MKCPHCNSPEADCARYIDAQMAWVCEATNKELPDDVGDNSGDDDEPTGSCDECGADLFSDDDDALCDQCLYYAELAQRDDDEDDD